MNPAYVFIGRFQPFHNGHLKTLRLALSKGDVVLVVGSADSPRTLRCPFTASEREGMIRGALTAEERDRVYIIRQNDVPDDAQWMREIEEKVAGAARGARVVLTGCKKDDSSYYLGVFPQWGFEPGVLTPVSGTRVRTAFFDGTDDWGWAALVPESTAAFLKQFRHTEAFEQIRKER
jgi:bifunctional NMN adenylyltransferase/nudix hydrolase